MTADQSKIEKSKILKQLTKESFAIALPLGIAAITILSFLFFGIGKHDDLIMLLGDVFAIAVISLLFSGFTFLISLHIKAAKHGIEIKPYDDVFFEQHKYAPSFDTHPINPATGLPMVGGIDINGNPYGCKLH